MSQIAHYNSLNAYLRRTFGDKVYKIALDGGMTCPNRDGTKGVGGCIFCSEGGSGDFAQPFRGDVRRQTEYAKTLVSDKIRSGKFIAYFQSYTNTYAPYDYLRKLFYDAVNCDGVVALSVATRPDCIAQDVLELLAEINRKTPVFVELGLQTAHDPTARLIRRGYDTIVYDDAVARLKNAGINVVTHVILGLPHEDEKMMLQTVSHVAAAGSDGIKLQLLHVLRGTALADMYARGEFETLSLERYADIVCDCLEVLPPSVVIHRLTGDAPKRLLIAPQWSADKKKVLNYINARLRERNVIQGAALLHDNMPQTDTNNNFTNSDE